jgi:hypothetical protein
VFTRSVLKTRDHENDAVQNAGKFDRSGIKRSVLKAQRMIMRLVAVEETGSERQIGEYTFNHTRTLPGPGKW